MPSLDDLAAYLMEPVPCHGCKRMVPRVNFIVAYKFGCIACRSATAGAELKEATASGSDILAFVNANPSCRTADIIRGTGIAKSVAYRVVDRLIARGALTAHTPKGRNAARLLTPTILKVPTSPN